MDDAPSKVPFELIDLQSDELLQDHFKKMPLLHFYPAFHEENFANLGGMLRKCWYSLDQHTQVN